MATSRKKKETTKLTIPNAFGAVKVDVGSHLTVYTFEDGSTKLEWDDAALMRDVQNAIANIDSVIPVTEEKVKKVKKPKSKA
jgi:hypothetical protein